MPEESRKSYPMLSQKSWWLLRIKFKQTIPRKVNSLYLKTVLGMEEVSATKNVLPYLKDIGLIDEEGNTQDFANKWRNDSEYPTSCEELKKKIYPTDLLDAIPDPSSQKKQTEEWFKSRCGVGEAAAKKMTLFYMMLCKAKVEDEERFSKPSEKPKETKPIKPKDMKGKETVVKDKAEKGESRDEGIPIIQLPAIHLNVQIHLTSDASTNQIDQLFASMAKHLKEFFPKKS